MLTKRSENRIKARKRCERSNPQPGRSLLDHGSNPNPKPVLMKGTLKRSQLLPLRLWVMWTTVKFEQMYEGGSPAALFVRRYSSSAVTLRIKGRKSSSKREQHEKWDPVWLGWRDRHCYSVSKVTLC